MDTMLFRQNTCKTGNNAVEMSQAFHDIARFERFTDLNLFNARELQVEVGCNYTPRQNLTPTGLPTCNQATSPPASVPQTPPPPRPSSFSCLCFHFMSVRWQKVFVFFPFWVLPGILGVYWVFGQELVFITSLYFHLTLAGKKWSARSTWIAGRRWFRCKKLKQTMHDNFFFLL